MHQLKDLMSRNVKVISPDMSIGEAARQMRDGDFGMMPVGDAEHMIGTISDRDIAIRAVALGLGIETKVRDVMSKGVSSALDTDTVDEAVKIMSERQVRRLPVVDQDTKLVGIVALGDLAVKASESKPAAQALSQISRPS
ncbi:MAG: CBS domain-containing protein [Vicinamibacteria bacterium]|nr:CBS domain-containing protein [Vicinamibacteria bacterium]